MKRFKKIMIICVILLAPLSVFLAPRFIKIDAIKCKSQYGSCNSLVEKSLASIKKGNLSATKKEVEDLLGTEFLVEDYQVYYRIPDLLDVDIVEKKPKFSITTPERKSYAFVDKEGYVLSFSELSDLPGIVFNGPLPEKGTAVSQRELFAMNVVYDVFSLYQIKEGKIDKESLVIELHDNLRVIFPLEGDRQELVGGFMLLYNEVAQEDKKGVADSNRKVSVIDLRFKNPILR